VIIEDEAKLADAFIVIVLTSVLIIFAKDIVLRIKCRTYKK